MARLPESLSSATGYLSVLCPMATGLGTVALLRHWPTSLAVLLPTLTPVWLLVANFFRPCALCRRSDAGLSRRHEVW